MKIKYSGPRPIISHTGIAFDHAKEDKYIYFNALVQIFKSVNHSYSPDQSYIYDTDMHSMKSNELEFELKAICVDLDTLMESQEHNMEDEIEHNLSRAHENSVLNKEEKTVLLGNIETMRNYMVQRSINKRVYYCVINKIAEIIKEQKIDHIAVPMFSGFAHILHSIQGSLSKLHPAIRSDFFVSTHDGELTAKLTVEHL